MHRTREQYGFTIVELLIVIVIIGILATITTIAYSGITNQAKAAAMKAAVTQWKTKSEAYKIEHSIDCPNNYAFIYGNSALGTSDFCVMKYEAKIQGNDVGTTTYGSSMVAESRPTGTPWVNITQTQAIAEAAALGSGYHLITEAEWMTIAADVLSVKYNWSGDAVGSGFVYQGHVNSNPIGGLAASDDDNDGLSGITGGTGSTLGTNSRRTFVLSSGDVIWDLSGNIYEYTQGTIAGSQQPGLTSDAGYNSKQWNNGSMSWQSFPASSRPSALASLPGLANINTWTSSNGIGVLHSNRASIESTRAYLRGGAWANTVEAGVFTLNLGAEPSGFSIYRGFRVTK